MEKTAQSRILVVDDELSMREFLELMLKREGYGVSCAESGRAAMDEISRSGFDLIICDIKLGDVSGIDVLRAAKSKRNQTVVIMISAYASTETAVEAMNEGAYDYVPKPFNIKELRQTVSRALTEHGSTSSASAPPAKKKIHFGKLIGNSPGMLRVYDLIRQVSESRTSVLITGESGTGKELIARAIHQESSRNDEPFVAVNCGGIPENLIESEIFGYKKGAFTGAVGDKIGFFEQANRGTVFLDEVGELPVALQVKLLRVVQEKVFKPVGGTSEIKVDVRIISATNKKLEEEVIEKRFREDLFYRLNVIQIKVPPLRDRKQDLTMLAQHFLDKYSREMGKDIKKISSYAVDLINRYNFPGNVRELENIIERSVALSSSNILLPEDLSLSAHKRKWTEGEERPDRDLSHVAMGVNLEDILQDLERDYLKKALVFSGGNKKKAAELLSLSFRSFRYRLKKLDIEKNVSD